jgi:hypothetical protein
MVSQMEDFTSSRAFRVAGPKALPRPPGQQALNRGHLAASAEDCPTMRLP